MASPAHDYVPVLRFASRVRYIASKVFGMKQWASNETEEKAHEYRSMQQVYINKLLGDLKDRLKSGDETPSILGNIIRQGLLKDEEVLLATYTGSMFSIVRPYRLIIARG